MQARYSLIAVVRKYRNPLIISLALSLFFVPIVDNIIVERDRNRNMLYGELFLTDGLDVYGYTDRILNETYDIPADHLLTEVLNVSYEYPIVTLLFYSGLAALEPNMFGPHYIANITLVLIFNLNIILFLYAGQNFWNKKWYTVFGAIYYFFGFMMSVVFGKADPLADLFWLISLILYQQDRKLLSGGVLGIAFQTKIYPAMILPIISIASPIALVGFLATAGALFLPLLLTHTRYDALISHFLRDTEYASSITNPFYFGHFFDNPISILAPTILIVAFLYCILETKPYRGIPILQPRLRTRNWKSIYIYLLPLSLTLVSWVLMWYYYWLVLPLFYFDDEHDMCHYQYMALGIIAAHFAGVILNIQSLLSGPIQDFLSHFKILT